MKRSEKRQAVSLSSKFILCITFLLLSACGGPRWVSVPKAGSNLGSSGTGGQYAQKRTRPAGQVAPGYLIGISSPDPKVSGEYRVSFDNSLKLPYNVRVSTKGLDEEGLEQAIQKAYSSFFKNPSSVQAKVSKKEYLIEAQGLVNKPGQYVVEEDSSIDEIISKAGGLQQSGGGVSSARYAKVSGYGGVELIPLADYHSGAEVPSPRWQGGETVFFQSAGKGAPVGRAAGNTVQMLGQVRNPAEYSVEPNADFFTYLIKAGGPTDRADIHNITVIRADGSTTQAMTFDMMEVEQVPQILAGDAIIVNADVATPLEKKSRIAASFANIASALGLVAVAATN